MHPVDDFQEDFINLLTDLHISAKLFLAKCPGCSTMRSSSRSMQECVCSDLRSKVMAVEAHVQKMAQVDLG